MLCSKVMAPLGVLAGVEAQAGEAGMPPLVGEIITDEETMTMI